MVPFARKGDSYHEILHWLIFSIRDKNDKPHQVHPSRNTWMIVERMKYILICTCSIDNLTLL